MSDQSIDAVSRARLDSLADEIGDAAIVHGAVRSFLDELVERLQAIRTSLSAPDPEEIKRAAHALGSPAAMLGATEVNRVCREIMSGAADGQASLAPLMSELDAVAAQTVTELRAYLGTSTES